MNRMSRMVSFRLSEREYIQIKTMCEAQGARSLSEAARAAVCHWLDAAPDPLSQRVDSIEQRMEALRAEIDRLSVLVGSEKP